MNSQEDQRRIDGRGNTKALDFFNYVLLASSPPPGRKKQSVHLIQIAHQLFIAGFDPIQLTFYGSLFYLIKEPATISYLLL